MRKQHYVIQALLALALVFLVNVVAAFWYGKLDMTDEKRFTLTEPTKQVVEDLHKNVYVRIYLKGDFPAHFKRLQDATQEMISQLSALSPAIEYEFVDPSIGTSEEVNEFRMLMSENEVYPVTVNIEKNDERIQKLIYPYAELNVDDRKTYVNLLEPQGAAIGKEEVINNSINLLEYKFAKALQNTNPRIAAQVVFTEGQAELTGTQIASVRNSLQKYYKVSTVNLDSSYYIGDEVDVLIVPRPLKPFSEKKKFILDQYLMNGGTILWLIDKLNASLDSLGTNKRYYPQIIDLNMEDMFFNYGFRLNDDVVLDLSCSQIPLTTGMQGNQPQIDLFDWVYHPVIVPSGKSEISKSLNLINLMNPSTFDTIKTERYVKKTPFLFTSEYSRTQKVPFAMSFDILREKANPALFNKGPYPTALLLEGEFSSLYRNRVPKAMEESLREIDIEYKSQSVPTRMVVMTDGELIENDVRWDTNEYREAGFNKYNQVLYANKQLILNAVEYLVNPDGIFKARNRDIKIRLLNIVKAQEERTYWQVLNIGAPLVILALFGIIYRYLRKRKYAIK